MMKSSLTKYMPLVAILFAVILLPEAAYAQNSVSKVLCEVYGYINGPVGSVIAMLGVISLGLIAMFGKIQISSVLTIMAGISLIFGAPTILQNFQINAGCPPAGIAASTVMGSEVYIILACIVNWFVGPMGKAIATLAIITLGLFASFGRVSWHQALVVSVGLAAMFGSVSIVQSLGVPVEGGKMTFAGICNVGGISIEMIFCNMLRWFAGPIGKGVATLAIIVLGLGALFGKVSWPMTMVVALGISLIFGSTSIVDSLGGQGKLGCHYTKNLQKQGTKATK